MKPLMIVYVLTVSAISAAESGDHNVPPLAKNVFTTQPKIQDFRKSVRDWADRVDERERLLKTIVESKKSIHKVDSQEPVETPEDQKLMESYAAADLRILQIEWDIARLTYLEGEDLIRRAAAMDVKENPVRKLVAKPRETHAGDGDASGGGSQAATPEMKIALENLMKLQNDLLREAIKNLPELKWAMCFNAESRYKFEKENLDMMRAALAKLEERDSPKNEDIK